MALVLEDGTGVSNANALVSLAEIKAYYAYHIYADSVPLAGGSDDAELEKLAVMSTRITLTGVGLKGAPTKPQFYTDPLNAAYQALPFPRKGVTIQYKVDQSDDPLTGQENLSYSDWVQVPANIVPKPIKDAICENIRFIATSDRAIDKDESNVKREKVDVIEVEYFEGTQTGIIPNDVLALMKDYLSSTPNPNVATSSVTRVRRF